MKTYLLSMLLFSLLCFISCDFGLTGDEDEDLTELEKLPPLTTTGENTFGYLINGKSIIVRNTIFQVAIFQQGQLQLGGGVDINDVDQGVTMILGDPLNINQFYTFNSSDSINARYYINSVDISCRSEFADTYDGSIMFSKIDRTNFIVSGFFDFSTVTESCDTLRITEGRFDLQYTP